MHLLSDIICAFGSRIGIGVYPADKTAYFMRNGRFPGIPMKLEVGVRLDGHEYMLPLAPGGEAFSFVEQEMTPTTLTLTGIDAARALSVQLTLTSLFRPQDVRFSTTPAVLVDVRVKRLKTRFRWAAVDDSPAEGCIFVRFDREVFAITPAEQGLYLDYTYDYQRPDTSGRHPDSYPVHARDFISVAAGSLCQDGIAQPFVLSLGEYGAHITFAWCAYDAPLLEIGGVLADFKYKEFFPSLESVGAWCREHVQEIQENARRVDGIFMAHNLSTDFTHLTSQALHTYLASTWYCTRNGADWYSCWEGGGYFQSSVDVEYSQAPFYLLVWPQLLEMELCEWAEHTRDGETRLGAAGRGTLYMAHDMGQYCDCNGQRLWIDQELEETTNYILMAYAVWKRTGRCVAVEQNAEMIRRFMDFILATDTRGDGIPSYACHTTLDDACLPLRTGERLTYIAVKSAMACRTGAELLESVGNYETAKYRAFSERTFTTIERDGWRGDHYAACFTDIEGADSAHIYTANGFALPFMTGLSPCLDIKRMTADIKTATRRTLCRYGCRHAAYTDREILKESVHGAYFNSPDVGWISMNETRDISAMYMGIDMLDKMSRYWDWQATVNEREYVLFLDTFYGNSLMFYPRGLAAFGYYDAALRFSLDATSGRRSISPLRADMQMPLLADADWHAGRVPVVETSRENGRVVYQIREETV